MGRMRLYNTATKKYEWWEIVEPKTPWRIAWVRLRAFLRHARRRNAFLPNEPEGPLHDLDPDTLQMRDRKGKRRWRRFRNVAHAVLSMVEMQKFIK